MRLQLAHFVNRQRVCRVVTLRPSSLPVAKFPIGYLDSILLVDFDMNQKINMHITTELQLI